MSRIQDLLHQKVRDVQGRKLHGAPSPPSDDRRVNWSKDPFRIIAEIKRSSLSAGEIRKEIDPVSLALSFESAGASAISVLTEENYFHGSLADLRCVSRAVSIPVLQKDFVVDEFQIPEAKEAGASFVLLIARFLSEAQLRRFYEVCDQLQMNAIVEITDEEDLRKLSFRPRFVGVNARDLQTLRVDISRFKALRNKLPDSFLIAESGIGSVSVLREVIRLGYNAALIGEHFLRATEPETEVARFARVAAPRVKVCGITTAGDAQLAVEQGASALGFIFAESPRRITREALNRFRHEIPKEVKCVGVFRGNSAAEIESTVNECRLDVVQTYDVAPKSAVVWNAKVVESVSRIDYIRNFNAGHLLIDLKIPEQHLPEAWNRLREKDFFALAGGLHAGNVAQAISLCRPEWIDVARGVESEPGRKSADKLRHFMKAVK